MQISPERSSGLPADPQLKLDLRLDNPDPVSFLTKNVPLSEQEIVETRNMVGIKPGMSPEQQLQLIKNEEEDCRKQLKQIEQDENSQHKWRVDETRERIGKRLALLVNVRKGLNIKEEIKENQLNQRMDEKDAKGSKLWALFLLKLNRADKEDDEELRKSLDEQQKQKKKKGKIHAGEILSSSVYFAKDVPTVDLVGMKLEVAKFALEAGLQLKGPALDLFANTASMLQKEMQNLYGNGENAPKLRFGATEDGNLIFNIANASKEQVKEICQNCREKLALSGVDVSNMLKNPTLAIAPKPEPGQAKQEPEPEPERSSVFKNPFSTPTLKPPTGL